jgi:hypothetical protein
MKRARPRRYLFSLARIWLTPAERRRVMQLRQLVAVW